MPVVGSRPISSAASPALAIKAPAEATKAKSGLSDASLVRAGDSNGDGLEDPAVGAARRALDRRPSRGSAGT